MSFPVVGFELERPADIAQRHWNKFLNNANRQTLTEYIRGPYGDHFKENSKTAPGGEYGYARRTQKYELRKQRKTGRSTPMVYRGVTQRKAGQSRVRATAKRATVRISPGHAITARTRAELEAVSAGEREQMAERHAELMAQQIEQFRATRKRVRKT